MEVDDLGIQYTRPEKLRVKTPEQGMFGRQTLFLLKCPF